MTTEIEGLVANASGDATQDDFVVPGETGETTVVVFTLGACEAGYYNTLYVRDRQTAQEFELFTNHTDEVDAVIALPFEAGHHLTFRLAQNAADPAVAQRGSRSFFADPAQNEGGRDQLRAWLDADPSGGTSHALYAFEDLAPGSIANPRGLHDDADYDDMVVMVAPMPTIDLAIDSNNDGTIDSADDAIEDVADDTHQPGRILLSASGDVDGDEVPDFADGYDIFGNQESDASAGFAPVVVTLSSTLDSELACVVFSYDGSDPGAVVRTGTAEEGYHYQPAPGHFRLWTKDGTESRSRAEIDAGGDYIASGKAYAIASLPDSARIAGVAEVLERSVSLMDTDSVLSFLRVYVLFSRVLSLVLRRVIMSRGLPLIACPCCGYITVIADDFESCPICQWEYERFQARYPDSPAVNGPYSLREAQQNFIKYGRYSPDCKSGRSPRPEEMRDPAWTPLPPLAEGEEPLTPETELKHKGRYCACCGYKTIVRLHQQCPVCIWRYEPAQEADPDALVRVDYDEFLSETWGGAEIRNDITLREAQQNYLAFGKCSPRYRELPTVPESEHERDPEWKPV